MNLFVFLTLVAVACGQRPNYLGGSAGQPDLAYRFRTNETTTITAIGNRLGQDGGSTPRIPVDARGDPELVDRLNTWPQENKPFWLLNYEKIEAMRNQQAQPGSQNVNNQQVTVQQRFGSGGSGGGGGNRVRNQPRDQRGFDPAYDYDDFGNRRN